MGMFDRFKKSSTPKKPEVDWDQFVTESIAEHTATAPKPLAPKEPFFERHVFGPLRRTVVTLAIVGACIVFIPIMMLIKLGAILPKEDPARRIQREYATADRVKADSNQKKVATVKPGPNNRDPNNPPGPRDDYVWVNDDRVKNGNGKAGYWRHK